MVARHAHNIFTTSFKVLGKMKSVYLVCLIFTTLNSVQGNWNMAGSLLGRGYDVVFGNPFFLRPGSEGADRSDPGMKPIRVLDPLNTQKLSEVAKTMVNEHECKKKTMLVATLHDFREKVMNEMFINTTDWYAVLQKYALANDGLGNIKFPEGDVFLIDYNKCAVPIVYKSSDLDMHEVTEDFRRAVCALPRNVDKSSYGKFFSDFGTSVLTSVKLGTLKIHSYSRKLNEMPSLSKELHYGEPMIQRIGKQHQQKASKFLVTIDENILKHLNKNEVKAKYGTHMEWVIGGPLFPAVVKLGVENIDKFVNKKYWPWCEDSESQCCKDLSTLSNNIGSALRNYPDEYMKTKLPYSKQPTYFVRWPEGTYSMIASDSACPSSAGFRWKSGEVLHKQGPKVRTEGRSAPNIVSKGGPIVQKFCTKDIITTNEQPWPKGSYCIYKHKDCPRGFESGWIYWDDVGKIPNRHSGVLPDGVYDANTQIYFCCRQDESPDEPIILPISEPFTLMRVGKKCQKVKWARDMESSVTFDGDWTTSWFRPGYFMGGLHPDNAISLSNNKLFYCLYVNNKMLTSHFDVDR